MDKAKPWAEMIGNPAIKDPADYIRYCEDNNLQADFETGFITILSTETEDKTIEDTLIRLHRLLFRLDMEIPEWIINQLDEYSNIRKENGNGKYIPPAHSSPDFYGKSMDWANAKRRGFLNDKLDELNDKAAYLNNESEEIEYVSNVKAIKRELYGLKTGQVTVDLEELKKYPIEKYIESQGIKIDYQGGSRMKCCCPIHNEKTGSFVIYQHNNSFYCFGCGAGGSIIDLIIAQEKVSLKESIEILRKIAT